jgi:hypothetical protein
MRWIPLLVLAVVGLTLGVGIGYLVWSPGASNYGVVSTANEETRTVWIHQLTVTFPSAVFAKVGSDSSITITVENMRPTTDFISVSLALARNNGVDAATISAIATDPYTLTVPSFGTANHVDNFKPSSTGYAIFDLTINGELAGTIILYVVPS